MQTETKKTVVAQFIGTIQDGGAETLVRDYALLMDKSKFDVIVIVLRRKTDTANDRIVQKNNVKIVPIFKHTSMLFKLIQKLNAWWYVPLQLRKILVEQNADILHVHMQLLRYVDRIAKFLTGIRIFYTCHNEVEYFLGPQVQKENAAAKKLIKNNHLQLIALHDKMRKEIDQLFGITSTVVIRNGINFARFNISENKSDIRCRLKIPVDAYVIGHIGRFCEQKNQRFLVRVFQEVCSKRKNAFLLLVGDGKDIGKIKSQLNQAGCRDKYCILSHRSDIPQLLRAMDVFVFPSLYEGLGIALIEAQVSGLRCIVSDTVPQEAFQTELAVPVSLNDPPVKWCDTILDETIKGTAHGDINCYDMNREIKRLERLYLGQPLD